jgi:hypothetical protein
MKDVTTICSCNRGPDFHDIGVCDNCNADTTTFAKYFGERYTNNTGLDGKTFFTGSTHFQVKEIEVFKITN